MQQPGLPCEHCPLLPGLDVVQTEKGPLAYDLVVLTPSCSVTGVPGTCTADLPS